MLIENKGYFQLNKLLESGAYHAFCDRNNAVSSRSCDRDYETLCSNLGFEFRAIAVPHQVREDNILDIKAEIEGCTFVGDADGIVTSEKGVALVIYSADCVPILLHDSKKHVIAAIHSGWQGTLLNIAGKGIRKMKEWYGCNPDDIVVGIGAAIGQCCFEVGDDLAGKFAAAYGADEIDYSCDKPHINLIQICVKQMVNQGVRRERIDIAPFCTKCDTTRFNSFRGDGGISGLMPSIIYLQ